jgi:type I restriction enzyme S subunit
MKKEGRNLPGSVAARLLARARQTGTARASERGVRRFKPYPAYKDSGVEWLGEISGHWKCDRLRYVIHLNPFKSEVRARDPQLPVSFVPMEAVGEYGGLTLDTVKPLAASLEGYTYFRDGDVIVAKITPCFENGKGALAAGLENGIGFGTTELHVLRVAASADARFVFYLTLSDHFRRLGAATMYGAGGQKRAPEDFIRNLRHPLPSEPEQRAIAAFLDRETVRIDALVAKKERLIELLHEKRSALITRAVTKGLDSNVPMKDSGVEWLGEIPAHWEVKPFTKYVVQKSDYRGKTPEKVASGVFLVTARNVRMGLIDYECSQEFVAQDEYDEIMRRGLPRKGDVLLTTEAPLGNVALVDREEIALAQRIIRFRMNAKQFDSRFTLFAMMCDYFQAQLLSLSTGSTAEGLKASKLSMLRLVAPPLTEQYVIVELLDRETARIDALVAKVRDAIERLRELRTALVSAAVTGKIDVRAAFAEATASQGGAA